MRRPPWWRVLLAAVVTVAGGLLAHAVGVSWRDYSEVIVISVVWLVFDWVTAARAGRAAQRARRERVPPAKSRV